MTTASREAADYFMPQERHFWRWADNGDVIEWQNGVTICYRAELVQLLYQLEGRVIPLSSLLLFLAACNESYKNSGCHDILNALAKEYGWKYSKELDTLLKQSIEFMEALSGLPKEIKNSIPKKAHILYEVFQPQATPSNLTWNLLADELKSGRQDLTKQTNLVTSMPGVFKQELSFLSTAGLNYPNTARLALKVLTGMPEVPEPLPVEIPEPENPDLLGQLATDPQTSGISYLTKHLIAALNIPMHSQDAGDQPLGGISDITNKGSYDRLLLSELAQDEELLTARLVNNEALYYRREESPDNVNRKRVLLLDTTIKMWGTPRAFGLSAALACSLNTKHGEAIEAYSLGDSAYTPIDIATAHGVIEALQLLNSGLHCAKALQNLISEQDKTANDEYILITGDWQQQPYDFQSVFSVIKTSLNFIISVDRSGDLQLYECINGNAKLISTSKFDLEELLFKKPVKGISKAIKNQLNYSVAFLNSQRSPLYFPTPPSLKLTTANSIFYYRMGVIAISDDKRLIYWKEKGIGAIELESKIDEGLYSFGYNSDEKIFDILICPHDKILKLYTFNSLTQQFNKHLPCKLDSVPEYVVYEDGQFNLKCGNQHIIVDCRMQFAKTAVNGITYFTNHPNYRVKKLDSYAKNLINPGYSILTRINEIKIQDNEIYFDSRSLNLFGIPKKLKITESKKKLNPDSFLATTDIKDYMLHDNADVKLKKHYWADGSLAVVDSRGLLHLLSSDENLPQITITLIINKYVSCWASDGSVAGSEYFLMEKESEIDVELFYNKYIQPFINRIVSAARS